MITYGDQISVALKRRGPPPGRGKGRGKGRGIGPGAGGGVAFAPSGGATVLTGWGEGWGAGWSEATGTQPNGDVSSWDVYAGADAVSGSAFAAKGNTIRANEDCYLTRVDFSVGGTPSQTVDLVIAKVSEVNPGTITEVLVTAGEVSQVNPGDGAQFTPASPVLLEAGTLYAIIWVRTDGGPTSALAVNFPAGDVSDPDASGRLTVEASLRSADVDPGIGDDTFYDTSDNAVVGMVIRTEGIEVT